MARSINHVVLWCGLVPLAAASGGCQRAPTWNLAHVEGTITKDGHALRGIEVVFVPDADTVGPRASGITDEAGHYRLRTDGGYEGAVVGPHRVCLHDTHRVSLLLGRLPKDVANSEKAQKKMKELMDAASDSRSVPSSYSRPNETPLRIEVHHGPQSIDLEVK
jgi:hypothetical protein